MKIEKKDMKEKKERMIDIKVSSHSENGEKKQNAAESGINIMD